MESDEVGLIIIVVRGDIRCIISFKLMWFLKRDGNLFKSLKFFKENKQKLKKVNKFKKYFKTFFKNFHPFFLNIHHFLIIMLTSHLKALTLKYHAVEKAPHKKRYEKPSLIKCEMENKFFFRVCTHDR